MKTPKQDPKTTKRGVIAPYSGADRCLFCGAEVPEGIMVCPPCERELAPRPCSFCNAPAEDGQTTCADCARLLLERGQPL